jgi:hypothetical protein
MKKLLIWSVPLALAAGMSGLLRADDAPPAITPQELQDRWQGTDTYLWGVEHAAAIAKDPESAGVLAVIEAHDFLKDKEPQVQIDFFNKALYEAKSRPVQRQIRLVLYRLFRDTNQNDKALEQLEDLMTDQ